MLLPLQCRLKQNLLFDIENLIKHLVSAVDVVLSNLCVGTIHRTKISFLLLLMCTDEVISTPKIMTFSPILPSCNENSECKSNPKQ